MSEDILVKHFVNTMTGEVRMFVDGSDLYTFMHMEVYWEELEQETWMKIK